LKAGHGINHEYFELEIKPLFKEAKIRRLRFKVASHKPLSTTEQMPKLDEDIPAKLKRWWMTPEYQELWVVCDGTNVSMVESLESPRHRSLCQVQELGLIVDQQATMTVSEIFAQETRQTTSIHFH